MDAKRRLPVWGDIIAFMRGPYHHVLSGALVGLVLVALLVASIPPLSPLPKVVQAASAVPMVAVGWGQIVGLKSDGTVVAVGENALGECNVQSWTGIQQVAAGMDHTVGLKTDGTVVAVGYNGNGECDVGSWSSIQQVTAGGMHTVGLKSDGTVVAVGEDASGQCDVGSWTGIRQVAAGMGHTLGLKTDGTVVAVGWNYFGQCNVGSWTGIQQVAAGLGHTVGLKTDGTVVAVGDNSTGECNVQSWTGIQQVAAAVGFTVGLKSNGTVVAVGDNSSGQCDVGSWTGIQQVAAGWSHTVGLKTDGTVVAVGSNNFGQCNVDNWTGIRQVAAGDFHTVGVKSDGTAVAVGSNNFGQCNVDNWTGIQQVAAGYFHTVGLKSDGTVVAVGNNDYGECNVDNWTGIQQVAAGYLHTVGLKSDGTVVAVGDNNYDGQCNVDNWTDIQQVDADRCTVGLKSDGAAVAVGWNYFGQCNVDNWTDIQQVAAGYSHTVGLKSDGTVVAVGSNASGQCNVGSWTKIQQVAATGLLTVGLKSDGTVVAAGLEIELAKWNLGTATNQPDLLITNLTWSPASPKVGDNVTFSYTEKNQGDADAGDFGCALYIDGTSMDISALGCLAAGQSADRQFTYQWTATAGNHTIRVVADWSNIVLESNESNNTLTKTLSITPGQPDLVIAGLTWSPACPVVGDRVTFYYTEKNQGAVDAGDFGCALYIDGTSMDLSALGPLTAGQSADRQFTYQWTATAGNHTIRVVADWSNRIAESNEGNNTLTKSLSINPRPLDLLMNRESIHVSPSDPSEGQPVTITGIVENRGDAESAPATIRLFQNSKFDDPAPYDSEADILSEFSVGYVGLGTIPPHGSANFEFQWNAVPILYVGGDGATLGLFLEVDSYDAVNDAWVNNDRLSLHSYVTVQANGDAFEPTQDGYSFPNWAFSLEDLADLRRQIEIAIDYPWIPPPASLFIGEFLYPIMARGGHCFGMASTSILYYRHEILLPSEEDSTFLLLKNQASPEIAAYHVTQLPIAIQKGIMILTQQRADLSQLYDSAVSDCPLTLVYDEHAVTVIDAYSVSDNLKNIVIYDNNYPGMGAVIQLHLDTNTAYYQMSTPVEVPVYWFGAPTVHLSDSIEKALDDLLDALVRSLWDTDSRMLIFGSPVHVTITDQDGRTVTDQGGGSGQVPGASVHVYETTGTKIFLLPKDLTYNVNVEAYDSGECTITQCYPQSGSSAAFSSAAFELSAKTTASFQLTPEADAATVDVDNNGDGQNDQKVVLEPTTYRGKPSASQGLPFWIWIIVGIGAAAVVALGILVWRRMVRKPTVSG